MPHKQSDKRKDGFYATPRVHINDKGEVVKLKMTVEKTYHDVTTGKQIPLNKTCFKSEVKNGRVIKDNEQSKSFKAWDSEDDYYDNDNSSGSNSSEYGLIIENTEFDI